MDPVTGRPCPPESAVHRLATASLPRPGPLNRALAKLQGRLASHATSGAADKGLSSLLSKYSGGGAAGGKAPSTRATCTVLDTCPAPRA